MPKTRTVPSQTKCPRCGGQLREHQSSIETDRGTVGWGTTRRDCPRGCLYTADEVREE